MCGGRTTPGILIVSDFPQPAVSSAANQRGSSFGSHTVGAIPKAGATCCILVFGVVSGKCSQVDAHTPAGCICKGIAYRLTFCSDRLQSNMVLHLGTTTNCFDMQDLVLQGVSLTDGRSHALTSDNGKSHGRGVASTVERNMVDRPASQPISRCVP